MKLHPRLQLTQGAKRDIDLAILNAAKFYELTPLEIVVILSELLAHWCKYPLRVERHPSDPNIPADVE